MITLCPNICVWPRTSLFILSGTRCKVPGCTAVPELLCRTLYTLLMWRMRATDNHINGMYLHQCTSSTLLAYPIRVASVNTLGSTGTLVYASLHQWTWWDGLLPQDLPCLVPSTTVLLGFRCSSRHVPVASYVLVFIYKFPLRDVCEVKSRGWRELMKRDTKVTQQ